MDVTVTGHITGFASYYIKFIATFINMIRTLTNLTKKNTLFNSGPLCQVSFDTIKITLSNSPILIFPN